MPDCVAVGLTHITHSFGEVAVLDDVSITVAGGSFVSIIGTSGCGKSTLLKVLTGLVTPRVGSVHLDGTDTTGKPGSVAYSPQDDLLLPWRRALRNATLGAEVGGATPELAKERAEVMFDRFGLNGFEDAWPSELSGGMRQRVAVLRTFLIAHLVLALDEPFGALDAITRRSMQHWLRQVWLEDKRTTLLVTHDIEEALMLSDRVIVMSSRPGRVYADIEVNLPLVRDEHLTTSQMFTTLKREVLDALASGD